MNRARSTMILAILAVVTTASLSVRVFAQKSPLKISTKEEIAEDVTASPCKNKDRFEAAKALFKKMGATDDEISVDSKGDLRDLVVTKKGKTDNVVIVGAHYDKVSDGCGAIDNWTGITIIAHIYRTMKDSTTNFTYRFVAFDSEESGLLGSAFMSKAIPKEKRDSVCSMVNFDSFGFTYPRAFREGSSSKMIAEAKSIAADVKMPFQDVSIPNAGADSMSFLEKGIPAITFDGLDDSWPKYLHTSNDKVENIKMDSVFVGYNFGLRFVATIDSKDCGVFRKK